MPVGLQAYHDFFVREAAEIRDKNPDAKNSHGKHVMSSTSSASSSPSSRSSARSPSRDYFVQLPNEVAHLIFDYLAPASVLPSQYKKRQAIFRRLSLVSKRFASLAQPYLLHVVKLSTDGHRTLSGVDSVLRRLRKSRLDAEHKIRLLIVENLEPKHRTGLAGVKGLLDKLQELSYTSNATNRYRDSVSVADSLSSRCLTPFLGSNIKRLHLCNVTILGSCAFTFPVLEQLSLDNVALPEESDFDYHLPRLRHFFSTSNRNKEYFLKALVPRLTSLTVPLAESNSLLRHLLHANVKCLVTVAAPQYTHYGLESRLSSYDLERMEISHLRLEDGSYLSVHVEEIIEELPMPVTLRSLYCPKSFAPASDWRVQVLRHVCETKGIELVFEDTGDRTVDCGRMSQEFIRRAEAGLT
ncbi:hypothetical protein JCM11491_005860 [Sporobolomyces phaffii]